MAETTITLSPQPGPQSQFLSSPADIAIYGGAAGAGKTFALLLEPLRHVNNSGFGAVLFRRESTQLNIEGGSIDEAEKMYTALGADYKMTPKPSFTFPSGAKVSFDHLQRESTVSSWQGSQIPLILFDELTHFTERQIFYMMSRNRSTCGVRPYIRATCNPDPDSFVAWLIAWWIGDDGYPIQDRSGVLRWFVRDGDDLVWADSAAELVKKGYTESAGFMPKSLTFIPGKLSDNVILEKSDPGYRANLMALPTVEREQLLKGNWKIRPAAGLYFGRSQVEIIDAEPTDFVQIVRAWDRAATKVSPKNRDPDWTVSVKMGRRRNGKIVILHVDYFREDGAEVEQRTINTAKADGRNVIVAQWQDPGAAGKKEAQDYAKLLSGFVVETKRPSGDKVTYFRPFASQVQAGNVQVVRGPWNNFYFGQLEAFPSKAHDDAVDATSRAYLSLSENAVQHISAGALSGGGRGSRWSNI